jgi:hypothetical protein
MHSDSKKFSMRPKALEMASNARECVPYILYGNELFTRYKNEISFSVAFESVIIPKRPFYTCLNFYKFASNFISAHPSR